MGIYRLIVFNCLIILTNVCSARSTGRSISGQKSRGDFLQMLPSINLTELATIKRINYLMRNAAVSSADQDNDYF